LRVSIIISGSTVAAVGVLLFIASSDPSSFQASLLVTGLGSVNLLLGVITPRAGGVSTLTNLQEPVKMIVDRGVIGSTIYLISFSDKKLVLKRLTSGWLTVLAVIVFAVGGLLYAGLIGAAAGGLTAFALQEFLTQKKRSTVEKGNLLEVSAKGDLEFDYDDIERVALTKSRLRLYMKKGVLGIVISRKYPEKIWPVLVKIMPSKTKEKD
jgi:zinc transporter ZupT